MSNNNGNYTVKIEVYAHNRRVDSVTFTGKNAPLDAMYHLDTKYSPSPISILKKFW